MHENAGNIGLRMDYFQLMYSQNYNIMCVAYRGYSESVGVPTETGLKLDGIAISECIRQQRGKIDISRLFLIGRSLGGAVAINTLKEEPGLFKAAIIENTFTSIGDMADVLFPFLKMIPNLKQSMLKMNWDSLKLVTEITTPILFITGDIDTFVPTEMTQRLYDAAKCDKKELMIVPGGNHNDTFMKAGESYGLRIAAFIKKCNK
jgi:fermentation-respiration switch protein FrsA (DUF1100 family)